MQTCSLAPWVLAAGGLEVASFPSLEAVVEAQDDQIEADYYSKDAPAAAGLI